MSLVRVGVLRGGPSSEYEVSLKTGHSVLNSLPAHKYQPLDILITKDGVWHMAGLPITPVEASRRVDVFFNALHGEYGEDGVVQRLLDKMLVPYTGSGAFASAMAMQKHQAKTYFKRHGVKTPLHVLATFGEDPSAKAREVFTKIGPPWIVKPADRGSAIGIFNVRLLGDLPGAIEQAFDYSPNIIIEEFIKGIGATCGVVENWHDQSHYAFAPVGFEGANFSDTETAKLKQLAVLAHRALDLKHYSEADFIVSTRGIYLLEVNTLPGLTDQSLMPQALSAEGVAYSDFLDHIVGLAFKRS